MKYLVYVYGSVLVYIDISSKRTIVVKSIIRFSFWNKRFVHSQINVLPFMWKQTNINGHQNDKTNAKKEPKTWWYWLVGPLVVQKLTLNLRAGTGQTKIESCVRMCVRVGLCLSLSKWKMKMFIYSDKQLSVLNFWFRTQLEERSISFCLLCLIYIRDLFCTTFFFWESSLPILLKWLKWYTEKIVYWALDVLERKCRKQIWLAQRKFK